MNAIPHMSTAFGQASPHITNTVITYIKELGESILGPGFAQFLAQNEFFTAAVALMLLAGLYRLALQGVNRVWGYLNDQVYCSISMNQSDEIARWAIEYLNSLDYMATARNVFVVRNTPADSSDPASRRPKLVYSPVPGRKYYFRYKGKFMIIEKIAPEGSVIDFNDTSGGKLSIQIWNGTRKDIDEFTEAFTNYHMTSTLDKTIIFNPSVSAGNIYWQRSKARDRRELTSVVLDEGIKESIVEDFEKFRGSQSWYKERGIPYRRGYILYGPPGTGKTSFIVALAGRFGLNLSILNFSRLDDHSLLQLMLSSTSDSILLLEDVDSVFTKRESTEEGATKVTFSGLLNALDGVGSAEGQVLFMTTNHIEKLSQALIRPGRIDRRFLFGLATKYQIREMYSKFFGKEHKENVVETIIEKIGNNNVSPAQLQGWFIQHMYSTPKELLASLPAFVESSVDDNKKE